MAMCGAENRGKPLLGFLSKVAVCFSLVCVCVAVASTCDTPKKSIDDSFLLYKPFEDNFLARKFEDFPAAQSLTRKSYFAGNRQCAGHRGGSDDECPSHLVITYNERRCPPAIMEVQCNCKKVGIKGNCKSVLYPRLVGLTEVVENVTVQHLVIYNASVGCKIVKPNAGS